MSPEEGPACRTLRVLHRFIEERAQDFSALLVSARRGNHQLEDLLACTADLGVLFVAAAEVQEGVLFPALGPWAGGPGGALERARREHLALRTHLSLFHRAVERMLFAPSEDRAERGHVLQRGHGLVATFEQHLGTEGDYLFRLADEHLDKKQALEIDVKVREELARKLPGRHPAWSP